MTRPNRQLAETIAAMQIASGAVADAAAQLREEKQAELDRAAQRLEAIRDASANTGAQTTP